MISLLLASLVLCHARGPLPDSLCTPGAIETADLAVVCGQSTRERRHVDEAMRRAVLASYGVPWKRRGEYEADHLVPLSLGGGNMRWNLWAQLIGDARRKDLIEDTMHRRVCRGEMTLAEAQRAMATDWTQAH